MEVRLAQLNIKNNFLKGEKRILLLEEKRKKGRNKKENDRKKEKIILSWGYYFTVSRISLKTSFWEINYKETG